MESNEKNEREEFKPPKEFGNNRKFKFTPSDQSKPTNQLALTEYANTTTIENFLWAGAFSLAIGTTLKDLKTTAT